MIRRLVLGCALSGLMIAHAGAQPAPRHGTGIALLRPPENKVIFVGTLSPGGRYAAGTAIQGGSTDADTQLHLWDLDTLAPDDPAGELPPERSIPFDVITPLQDDHLAFSPDERWLAVLLPGEVRLLEVPTMEVARSFPTDADAEAVFPADLVWSPDRALLAAGFPGQGLQVWDWAGQEDFRFDFPSNLPEAIIGDLLPFGDGWLYGVNGSFAVCTRLLDACQSQPVTGRFLAADDVHQIVITGDADDPSLVTTWVRGSSGLFEPDDRAFEAVTGIITGFSPDGRYLSVMQWTSGESPDYPFWTLWDAGQQRALYRVGRVRPFVWLGDTELFVDGDGGVLYSPQSSEPLDALPDIYSIPGIAEATLEATSDKLLPYHEVRSVREASADGRRYLLVLGGTALVIPVVVE